jgi:hypothetical protein
MGSDFCRASRETIRVESGRGSVSKRLGVQSDNERDIEKSPCASKRRRTNIEDMLESLRKNGRNLKPTC